MLCSRCNKDGAKPYKYKDGATTVYLCDDCFALLSSAPAEKPDQPSQQDRSARSFISMQRRCPSCGTALSEIRRTGYVGCADCFFTFKTEILNVIDKMQNGVLTSPESKQREMTIISLEEEYAEVLESAKGRSGHTAVLANRLRSIEQQLLSLGVSIDGE